MKTEIQVPRMGESITEATIGTILKPTGSSVSADDEILELETDKVNQSMYAPQAGIVQLSVKTGDVVKIGQVIGYIETEAAPKKPPPAEEKKVEEEKPQEKPAKSEPQKEEKQTPEKTKPEGQSKEAFVLEPAPEPKKIPAPTATPSQKRGETRRKISKIRQVIAERLVKVRQTTAMLTTFNEIDMSQVIAIREKYKDTFAKEHGTKLGFMSFFVKACLWALKDVPDLNSYIDGDEIVHRDYCDIGVAVGTDRGVIVPVIRNCEDLSFAGIESAIETFAKKAREGTISVEDLEGGGLTITNGGVYGSLLSTPILNPQQSGILGMHKIIKRPVVIEDQVMIRPMMYVALSYDHRIVDGKEAVTFLVHVKDYLEDPSRLLLEF